MVASRNTETASRRVADGRGDELELDSFISRSEHTVKEQKLSRLQRIKHKLQHDVGTVWRSYRAAMVFMMLCCSALCVLVYHLLFTFQTKPLEGSLMFETRRNVLDEMHKFESPRTKLLVEAKHLEFHRALNMNFSKRHKPIRVLVLANQRVYNQAGALTGRVEDCNIPCERFHALEGNIDLFDGIVYPVSYTDETERNALPASVPSIAYTLENWYLTNRMDTSLHSLMKLGPLNFAREYLSLGSEFTGFHRLPNFLSTYEMDSHIPTPYSVWIEFWKQYKPLTKNEIMSQLVTRKKRVVFMASHESGPLRPMRIAFLKELVKNYPICSFGKGWKMPECREEQDRIAKELGRPKVTGHDDIVSEAIYATSLFGATIENSPGTDYVTEKLATGLLGWTVPIYHGAPNVVDFLPDRDAAIHVSDFDSPADLANYLHHMSNNLELLYEKHLKWRTFEKSQLSRTAQRIAELSNYNIACLYCHCFAGTLESCQKK